MKKRIFAIFLALCLVVSIFATTAGTSVSAVTTTCTTYSGSNVERQNYDRWSSPITSYLTVCEDGSLMRVQYGQSVDGVLVEYYDEGYNLLSTKTISEELPLFGGFYGSDSNYYLITGQTNKEESAEIEVIRLTKYDHNWNRIASVGLYDANTTVPFDAGSVRMEQCGDYLVVRTSHEMYTSSDGLNHQSNLTIQYDVDAMTVTDSFSQVMNNAYGYVSHSFNQFIHIENNKIVAVDHGDAHPRSIALLKYPTDVSSGRFTPTTQKCEVINVLAFLGETGENVTGASVGGFEISDSAYLLAGNSVVQDEDNLTRTTRNIFVASVDKSTSAVTLNWITNYEEGDGTTSTPHLVKLAANSYMLLWTRDGTVYYTKIDSEGKQSGDVYTMAGSLSDCVPIVVGNKLVWYTWDNETNTFYDIDLNNLSATNTTVIENGHRYEYLCMTDGYATLKCTACGDEKEVLVATSITTYWKKGSNTGYYNIVPDSERLIGDVLWFWVGTIEPSNADGNIEVIVSDPTVVSYEETDAAMRTGTLTMLKKGTATVTIRPKYNPDATQTYTFTVDDHVHEYEWKSTEDGVITFGCKYCTATKTDVAATSMNVWWNENGGTGYYWSDFTNGKDVGEELYVWVEALPDGTANTNITVKISDPDIISYTPTTSDQRMGVISMLKTGKADITFYSTYNPSVKKTYTIKVNGDLAVDSFTADKETPQLVGSQITLTADAIGGTWNYEYKFYEVKDGEETVLQDYSSQSTCLWTPDSAGTKTLKVEVKDSDGNVATSSMEYEVVPLKLTKATLLLENDFSVVFKAPVSIGEVYHDSYVEVVQEKENGETETVTISGKLSADGRFYEFVYTGVDACEVGDNLDATIFAYDSSDQLVRGQTTEDFSVKAYCMGQLPKTAAELGLSEERAAAFKTLLVDLLNYAAEAQEHFDYKTDALVNADLTDEQKELASTLGDLQDITNSKQVEIEEPSAAWKAAGLNLLNKTTVRLKFQYAGDISEVSMAVSVDGGEPVSVEQFESAGDGLYYVYFDGITAYQFSKPVDFTLKIDDTAISNTLRYNVESYAFSNQEDAEVGDIVSALMKYGKAAVDYNQVID